MQPRADEHSNASDDIDNLTCPITSEIFFDPVITICHHVFEREAITKVEDCAGACCPLCRHQPLAVARSCLMTKDRVEKALAKDPSLVKERYLSAALLNTAINKDQPVISYFKAIKSHALEKVASVALTERSERELLKKNFGKVLTDCCLALNLDPNYAPALYNRGLARFKFKLYLAAETDLTTSIQIKPEAKSYALRARIRYRQKNFAGAIADANEALRLQDDSKSALRVRGKAKLATGDHAGALEDLLNLHPHAKNKLAIDADIALTYIKLNDFKLAKIRYNRMIRAKFRLDQALYGRGIANIGLDLQKEALDDFNASLAVRENAKTYHARGIVHFSAKRYVLAKQDFIRALELDPSDESSMLQLIITYYELRDFDAVVSECHRCLTTFPQQKRPLVYLATVKFEQNHVEEALTQINAYLAVANCPKGYTLRGEIHEFMRQEALALADYTIAINTGKASASAYQKRGQLFYAAKKWPEALQDLNAALHSPPHQIEQNYILRGQINQELHNTLDAIDDFQQAAKLDPKNIDTVVTLIELYTLVGNFTTALDLVNSAKRLVKRDRYDHIAKITIAALKIGKNQKKSKQEADEDLEEINRILFDYPNHVEALALRCHIYIQQNQYALAATEAKTIIAYAPHVATGYICLAKVFAREDSCVWRAEILIEKALAIDPNNAEIYLERGRIRHAFTYFHLAKEDYDRAAALDPAPSFDLYNARAKLAIEYNDKQQAMREYSNIIHRASSPVVIESIKKIIRQIGNHDVLAEATTKKLYQDALQYFTAGQTAVAHQAINLALSEHPRNIDYHLLSAKIDISLGLLESAAIHLKHAVHRKPTYPELLELIDIENKLRNTLNTLTYLEWAKKIAPNQTEVAKLNEMILIALVETGDHESIIGLLNRIPDKTSMQQHLLKYAHCMLNKNLIDAVSVLTLIIDREKPAFCYKQRGKLLVMVANHSAAIKDFDSFLAIKASSPDVLLMRSELLLAERDTEAAKKDCIAAEKLYLTPQEKERLVHINAKLKTRIACDVHYRLAKRHFDQQQCDASQNELNKALELDPDDPKSVALAKQLQAKKYSPQLFQSASEKKAEDSSSLRPEHP